MAYAQGTDCAKYQGTNGQFGRSSDQFMISQIGGISGGRIYDQTTYSTQVKHTLAVGKRAHTYIWFEVGSSTATAKRVLDYILPRIKTPKGSIVALDYEAGASGSVSANTSAIIYAMDRIKAAGYTPMFYSGADYTRRHVDISRLGAKYGTCLWIASYATNNVISTPNFQYFPSMKYVAIWQFTSHYAIGSLDGNVDLTGITLNGYKKPAAVKAPATTTKKEDDDMPAKDWRQNAAIHGIAWMRQDVTTYKDEALTQKYQTLKKGAAYKVFQIKDGIVDLGGQWARGDQVLLASNPLYVGIKTTVRNTDRVMMTNNAKNLDPGSWAAFGIVGDQVDLGNGQTAPAAQFEVYI